MLSYVDRANVGNARLFGAQQDTGLTDTEWNIGLSLLCESFPSVFEDRNHPDFQVITFAVFGLPSNILVKRYGPKKVLPVLLMAVGGVLIGAGCCSSPAAWFALRLRESSQSSLMVIH